MAALYSRKAATVLACMCVLAAARAEAGLFHWRGLRVERAPGSPPSATSSAAALAAIKVATVAQLGLALKQIGFDRVNGPPADADGDGECVLHPRVVSCVLRVAIGAGKPAERRLELPLGDADQVAETLALVIADLLAVELKEVAHVVQPPKPPPSAWVAPVPAQKTADKPATVTSVATPPHRESAVAGHGRGAKPSPPVLGPLGALFELGGTLTAGFSGEPLFGGATVRLVAVQRPLLVGAGLAVSGASAVVGRGKLALVRAVLGPRIGAGLYRRGVWIDADLSPQLVFVVVDAGVRGQHTLVTGAAALGLHLDVNLKGGWGVGFGVEVAATFSRLTVLAPELTTPAVALGYGSIGFTLGLSRVPTN